MPALPQFVARRWQRGATLPMMHAMPATAPAGRHEDTQETDMNSRFTHRSIALALALAATLSLAVGIDGLAASKAASASAQWAAAVSCTRA